MALADLVRFTDQSFLVLLDCAYLISHLNDFLQDSLLDVRGCLNQRLQPERLLCPRLPTFLRCQHRLMFKEVRHQSLVLRIHSELRWYRHCKLLQRLHIIVESVFPARLRARTLTVLLGELKPCSRTLNLLPAID